MLFSTNLKKVLRWRLKINLFWPITIFTLRIWASLLETEYYGHYDENTWKHSKQVFERDDLTTPFLAQFPAEKNAGKIPCTIYNILLPPTGWHLIPFHHPQRVYGRTEYADVTTKFSRMDSNPNATQSFIWKEIAWSLGLLHCFREKKQQSRVFLTFFLMFKLTWILEKELEPVIEMKETNFVGIGKTRKFHSGGEQMRNASGRQGEASEVKMSSSETIKANMNTGNKIFGKHIRQFLHKKKSVTRKVDVLVVQNGIEVVQARAKKDKKACCTCKFVFFFRNIIYIYIYIYIVFVYKYY